jgi:anti-anti-sigma regulatory factor
MNMIISQTGRPVRVSVLRLDGELNGSNFEILIEEAKRIFRDGSRDLILDLSLLTYISSAGLAALHQVGLLYREDVQSSPETGWAAFRAIDRDRGKGPSKHVKLCSPRDEVLETINLAGFSSLFEIFSDMPQAVASFQPAIHVLESSVR